MKVRNQGAKRTKFVFKFRVRGDKLACCRESVQEVVPSSTSFGMFLSFFFHEGLLELIGIVQQHFERGTGHQSDHEAFE